MFPTDTSVDGISLKVGDVEVTKISVEIVANLVDEFASSCCTNGTSSTTLGEVKAAVTSCLVDASETLSAIEEVSGLTVESISEVLVSGSSVAFKKPGVMFSSRVDVTSSPDPSFSKMGARVETSFDSSPDPISNSLKWGEMNKSNEVEASFISVDVSIGGNVVETAESVVTKELDCTGLRVCLWET